MRPANASRLAALLAAITGSACPHLHAQETVPGAPIELPKYTVTAERELPPPESWHYVRLPGFEVLSNASAGRTRDLLDNFQRFTNAVNLVWPGLVPPHAAPATLIICGAGDQFAAFLPEAARRSERAMASITLRARERSAIVLDQQNKVLDLASTEGTATEVAATVEANGVIPGFAVDAYQQLYREYLRCLLTGREPPPPAWFVEGLAQLFMAMEVTNTSITLGKLEDPNLKEDPETAGPAAPRQERDFNAILSKRALLPLPEMFAVAADSDLALNPLDGTWAKQCYAFVHWGLYGEEGVHQKDFFTFLARLEREPPGEALFRECFRKSYGEMLTTLRSYIEITRHKVAGVRAEKGRKIPEPPPVVLREATPAEIGRLKGETLLLAGRRDPGRTALLVPYLRGERDPALLAALGIAEADGGDPAKARRLLEAAAAAHFIRPRAGVELARLRLAEARTRPEGVAGRISARQTAAVLEPLLAARNQPPALPELYELVAEAWTAGEAAPPAAQLAVLDEGVRLFPRDATLVYADASLKARSGLIAEAESLVRLGLRVAADAATREKFESLRAGLPPAPVPPLR